MSNRSGLHGLDVASASLQELAALGIRRGAPVNAVSTAWSLAVFSGRFAEISGSRSSAALTLVFRLVHEAQKKGEPVVWIMQRDSVFFPPDVAGLGVDLEALPVVRTSRAIEAARAADKLLRSGGFGLVLLDIGAQASLPIHAQTRLVGLAKRHDVALICITEKEDRRPSVGSLVSLRAHTERSVQREGSRYRCEVRILKDKRCGPGWKHREVCHGPDGLC